MKETKRVSLVLGLAVVLAMGTALYAADSNTGASWYCPRAGQMVSAPQDGDGAWTCPGYGPGYGGRHAMMGGAGRGYGHGMGYGRGWAAAARTEPVSDDEAKRIFGSYLNATGNANLKLGTVADKGDVFEAQVVTKDNSLVDTLQVDKNTGRLRFVR